MVARQTQRSFPERVDFVTSPGFLDGGDARQRLGMPGDGPSLVVTDLGCYDFEDGEMTLVSLHPGVTLEKVRAEIGLGLRVAPDLATTEPPTEDELRVLRSSTATASTSAESTDL